MQNCISKRKFLKLSALSAGMLGAGTFLFRDEIHQVLKNSLKNNIDFLTLENNLKANDNFYPLKVSEQNTIHPGDLPIYQGSVSDGLPLTKYFPELDYSSKNKAKVQIINIYHKDFQKITNQINNKALIYDSLFSMKTNPQRFFIPWIPLFKKTTPVYKLKGKFTDHAYPFPIYIKDEGSSEIALFGNKARKYEFAFPFCLQTRAKKIITFGSLASNHCIYTALTSSCSDIGKCFNGENPEILVNLYPQKFHPLIEKKLKYLLALGARIRFLDNDLEIGTGILTNRAREYFSPDDDLAYYEPGGSNPLTTLAHINAAFELNDQIRQGNCPLNKPPDYIFTALGSGGTCMGLVLGCFLLGWKTKIVGTTSQDKSMWKRALVFGNPSKPFLVQNAEQLLKKTIELVKFFDLPGTIWNKLNAEHILKKNFLYDNLAWEPAYGIPSGKTQAIIKRVKKTTGLILDHTFTGKSFTTLIDYANKGILNKKSVLFWNTHHRYNFMANKKVKNININLLPQNLMEYLSSYINKK